MRMSRAWNCAETAACGIGCACHAALRRFPGIMGMDVGMLAACWLGAHAAGAAAGRALRYSAQFLHKKTLLQWWQRVRARGAHLASRCPIMEGVIVDHFRRSDPSRARSSPSAALRSSSGCPIWVPSDLGHILYCNPYGK